MNKPLVITDELQENTLVPSQRALPFECRWVVLVCMLLGVSGGIRYWRDLQFQSLSKESKVPPFALKEIPNTLGEWHAIEGSESTLEPEIARIAGATDYLIRTYVHEKSNARAEVLILYGLAAVVFAHTPDACYPAKGFRSVS